VTQPSQTITIELTEAQASALLRALYQAVADAERGNLRLLADTTYRLTTAIERAGIEL
jgi:hypothetical protein